MPEFLSEFVRFLFAAGLVLGGGLWLFSGWQRYVQPQQWIQLLHHAPSGVLLVGEDRVLRANLAAYLLLGIRLVGRHYLFSAEQSEESQQAFYRALASSAQQKRSVPLLWPVPGNLTQTLEISASLLRRWPKKLWLVNVIGFECPSHDIQQERHSLAIARTALDSLSELIFIKSTEGHLIATNRAFDQFWQGRIEEGSATFKGIMKGRTSQRCWTVTPDGRSCLLETYQRVLMSPQGENIGLLGISHDVTDWYNMQRQLREEMEKRRDTEVALAQRDTILQNILESSPDSIGIFNENMVYQACNQPFVEALGIAEVSDLVGKRLQDVIPEHIYARLSDTDSQVLHQGKSLRYIDRIERSDGEFIWFDVVKSPFRDPASGTNGVLIMARDVSERYLAAEQLEAANQELERLSFLDSLTHVANRRRFDEQLHTLWHLHVREGKPLSIILCDVDYFKDYNDAYGHLMGDETLKQIAIAFTQVANRHSDCVARYGGEEFGILLPNTPQSGAILVAERIHEKVRGLAIPHEHSKVTDRITVSLGIVTLIPRPEDVPEQMVELADRALYQAKANGRNQTSIYQPNH
ncbi:diguanylate cyclase domain-containing protein [Vibrio cholerae]|uniref:diguanylate cyclase domain-containing protein n=1 Tax=Vibrio cholerae TaxID=666 RepID=UPI00115B2C0F|nr:diguanylate cyclase [Vibrio cholerae]EGR4456842.1 diguanylate cyclase [Vibrio cholerae]EGR5445542.1 diguanylate cyclase [Vibrio cholerae]EGR5454012.1 diguanylate cyclase [Vibrio cholerae]EGR5462522.1 diguanylate cyclase [Vibrio cholerae]EJL6482896.1 diguanylate cyclase [Vibrio cholerae]